MHRAHLGPGPRVVASSALEACLRSSTTHMPYPSRAGTRAEATPEEDQLIGWGGWEGIQHARKDSLRYLQEGPCAGFRGEILKEDQH